MAFYSAKYWNDNKNEYQVVVIDKYQLEAWSLSNEIQLSVKQVQCLNIALSSKWTHIYIIVHGKDAELLFKKLKQ